MVVVSEAQQVGAAPRTEAQPQPTQLAGLVLVVPTRGRRSHGRFAALRFEGERVQSTLAGSVEDLVAANSLRALADGTPIITDAPTPAAEPVSAWPGCEVSTCSASTG